VYMEHISQPDPACAPDSKYLRYREANRELLRAKSRQRYAENPERHRASTLAWKMANLERLRKIKSAYQKANKEKCAAATAGRKAIKMHACPSWAEAEIIELIYSEAAHRGMHVDHIIPL